MLFAVMLPLSVFLVLVAVGGVLRVRKALGPERWQRVQRLAGRLLRGQPARPRP